MRRVHLVVAIGGAAAALLMGPTAAAADGGVAGTVSVGKGRLAVRARRVGDVGSGRTR